ncbi:hypothetical protein CVS29_05535 [Arthrobacter psychrochitiniphilus]|uniref:Uncharacterized protein n=1 Tax=Arthrobacter psychrochitiniphilus TaxID=291045 RepID=A0A2V3DWJ9_9MICC|nr:hypothetical protein CVS29_05535 [Arthrobacter psychrochitiniphilus]
MDEDGAGRIDAWGAESEPRGRGHSVWRELRTGVSARRRTYGRMDKSVLAPDPLVECSRQAAPQKNLLLRKCRNRLDQRRWVHICVLTN